ncbi:MAG: hypothetical protein ABIK86_05180 [candidate division WOR-3 bacterium]
MRLLAALAILALSTACEQPEPADYFPLVPGAQRVMRVYTRLVTDRDTSETTVTRLVELVHGERELPQLGRVWVVESPRDSGRSTFTFFRKRDDGIIQVLPVPDRQPVEMLYLALPLSRGLKWYDSRDQREVMEVTNRDTVRLETGTFPNCYEVTARSTRQDWTLRQWLAPDIGPVKWENLSVWTDRDGVRRVLYRRAELVEYRASKPPIQ